MGELNPNLEGARAFGDLLSETLEDQDITLDTLVALLADAGFATDKHALSRLRRGTSAKPDAWLIRAIARIGLLKCPDGKPFTHDELLQIVCGQLDPKKLQSCRRASDVPVEKAVPFPEAVRLLRQLMADQPLDQIAKRCYLTVEQLEQILRGRVPTRVEVAKFGPLFPDRDISPLLRAYGTSDDAPLTEKRTDKAGNGAH